MKRATVDTGCIGRVEYALRPPLGKTITLPVLLDGKRSVIDIYITTSAWLPPISDEVLIDAARDIAWRINRTVP